MRVAVIGASGQLGSDLMEALSSDPRFTPMPFYHSDLDVRDQQSCRKLAGADAVVNTAAFHRTDVCEEKPAEAFEVNAVGSYNVAKVCNELGSVYVYVSTDYVFSGGKGSAYTEEDDPAPLNVYGVSKLAGETLASLYADKWYVVRSSSLFGRAGASGKGGNFVETIVGKVKAKEAIRVVDDITMSPTNTKHLAEAVAAILAKSLPYGVYHVANSGSCTWWEFAQTIVALTGSDARVEKISSADYPSKAMRPKNSALASVKLPRYGLSMRNWRDALSDYLRLKGYVQQ